MIIVKDSFWQEFQIFILSSITSLWMKTGVMFNTRFQLAASVGCKSHSSVSVLPPLLVFPDLIYTRNCNFLSSALKFVSFLHELKVYSIIHSNFMHDKLRGARIWLHIQDSLPRCRKVPGVWSSPSISIFSCSSFATCSTEPGTAT